MIQEVLSEMNTDYLKKALFEFPDKIVERKKAARVLREAFEDADQTRAMLEAVMTTEIADAVSPNTGKALFSNETARKAELLKRKAECAEYQAAQQASRRAQFALSEVEDELAMLYDKFKAVRYVARLVTAEIEYLAGDDVHDEGEDDPVGGLIEDAMRERAAAQSY